jgi:exosortase
MAHAVSDSTAGNGSGGSCFDRGWPTLVVLGGLWLLAVNQLRIEWSLNPQYSYGWTVPFLALYLGLERWKDRPAAAPGRSGVAALLAALPAALLLLPLRLVQESAPDWRLVSWVTGLSCVAISLSALWYAGGRTWVLHFLFPIAFLLVAVPWPVPLEQGLIQRLMGSVATICVEALGWCGIAAIQNGNVIEISTGKVGIEEACSGVRSLQTTLMIALFLGELFRFGWLRRLALLGGGLVVAYVCNAGRSFFLVWITTRSGPEAVAKWHDQVGLTVLIVSLAAVGLLCALIRPGKIAKPADAPPAETPAHFGRPLSKGVLIGFATWLVCVEVGTELWYRTQAAGMEKAASWSVNWPTDHPGFRNVEFGEATRTILRYTDGRSAVWQDADGLRWAMVFLRWAPGRSSVQLARAHGPEICLPASGTRMTADLGLRPLKVKGIELPMRAYIFSLREQPLYVFYCLWEQAPDGSAPSSFQSMTVARRLDAVRAGRRNEGQQVLELAVSNVSGPEEAEAAVTRLLEQSLQL